MTELTREQDNTIERLALTHDKVCVHAGVWNDETIQVTVPDGTSWRITPAGVLHRAPFNHGVNWDA